jgi:uncharacterized protein YjbI with pentapeptide repeats
VRKAIFDSADFSDAGLSGASFRRGSFRKTNLRGTNLRDATVDHADPDDADVSEANVESTDPSDLAFTIVRWEGIQSVKMANLQGVKNAPAEFVTWALATWCRAIGRECGVCESQTDGE